MQTAIGLEKQARLSADRLRQVLSFNSETGFFAWRVCRGRVQAGDAAGYISAIGYVRICVDGTMYSAHRLAWLYTYGEWPPMMIDHVNRDRKDNRIVNLRCVTPAENRANSSQPISEHQRDRGVGFDKKKGKWRAYAKFMGRFKHLGLFTSKEAATARRHQFFDQYLKGSK